MTDETTPWPDFLLRVPTLDRDHAELFRLLEDLQATVLAGNDLADPHAASAAIDRLLKYVSHHFRLESDLMRQAGLPPAAARAHEAEHTQLLRRIAQWQDLDASHGPKATLVGEMAGYVYAWMVHHIKGLDAELARFIEAQGAVPSQD